MTTGTHEITNLLGAGSETIPCLHDKDLSRKLTQINRKIHPCMIIIDCTHAPDGQGPLFGISVPMNLIISAHNPVGADAMGLGVARNIASTVEHIAMAEHDEEGASDLAWITINTASSPFALAFQVKKTGLDSLVRILLNKINSLKNWWTLPPISLIIGIEKKLLNADTRQVSEELTGAGL